MKLQLLLGIAVFSGTAHAGQLSQWHNMEQRKAPAAPIKVLYTEPNARGISEIGLERTMCEGMCPEYTVLIQSDGTVSYQGGKYAPRKGRFFGKITRWRFNQLARHIDDANYQKLSRSYASAGSCMPSAYTSVVTNRTRKVVRNYGHGGPEKLQEIEMLIDAAIKTVSWDKSAKPKPAK